MVLQASGANVPGVGIAPGVTTETPTKVLCLTEVFLEYADTAGSAMARNALSGRKFGGNVVSAVYYPEDKYFNRDYNA
ncbi:hypothetical protein HHK36_023675 [Tetracentron sinense]|uniref:Uncharacterized protein n=1 Tax=Tetracentron sinense TaxID=13715 RepID=A0A834YTL5_TETSI|nr:hypothetical protein HHK36_023675 [Tetracentron sinense]